MRRILVAEPDDFSPEAHAFLTSHADVTLAHPTSEELAAGFRDFDAVWIRLGYRISAEMLAEATRCRVLACPATGTDHIDLQACRERGIRVVNLKGETEFLRTIRATAELTIALVLALMRHVPAAANAVLRGEWNRDAFRGRELAGKSVGLVGVGRLGMLVAEMLSSFGVDVLGYDVRPDIPTSVRRCGSLGELLAASDIVSLHVSYDHSTHHMIGPKELAQMRRGALLINTARGGIIDEGALVRALKTGVLGGAALDVISGEPHPDPDTHPLIQYARQYDNLIIVPHIGGNTTESFAKTEMFIAKKVVQALEEEGT